MALIDWGNDLSVNGAEIDRQHQQLVATINELHESMRQRKSREVMAGILDVLFNYTATHFQTEERYFDQFSFAESASHKKEHAEFVQKASEFKTGFEEGKLGLSIDVMTFLSDWIRNHIKGSDKQYTELFNRHGLN